MSLRLDVHKADMLGRGKGFFSTNKKRIGCTDRSFDRGGKNGRNAPCKQRHRRSTMQTQTQTRTQTSKNAYTHTYTHTHADTRTYKKNASTKRPKNTIQSQTQTHTRTHTDTLESNRKKRCARVPVFLFWGRAMQHLLRPTSNGTSRVRLRSRQ